MPPPAHLPSLRSEHGGAGSSVSLVPTGSAGIITVLLQYYYNIKLQYYYSTIAVQLQYYYSIMTVLLQYYYSIITILLQ